MKYDSDFWYLVTCITAFKELFFFFFFSDKPIREMDKWFQRNNLLRNTENKTKGLKIMTTVNFSILILEMTLYLTTSHIIYSTQLFQLLYILPDNWVTSSTITWLFYLVILPDNLVTSSPITWLFYPVILIRNYHLLETYSSLQPC